MELVWDEPKRLLNLAKHGFDFAELTEAFFETAAIVPAKQGRYLAIGDFNGIAVVAVVIRPLGAEAVSVISMRRADRQERRMLDG